VPLVCIPHRTSQAPSMSEIILRCMILIQGITLNLSTERLVPRLFSISYAMLGMSIYVFCSLLYRCIYPWAAIWGVVGALVLAPPHTR